MTIKLLGLYPIQKNIHLIECLIKGMPDEVVRVGEFTQPRAGVDRSGWQVAYDEHLLNRSGSDGFTIFAPKGIQIETDLRVAFFMHHLELRLPLATPGGELRLPDETPKPERLGFLKYREP